MSLIITSVVPVHIYTHDIYPKKGVKVYILEEGDAE